MTGHKALIFPGYGSQYVGMGKELYDAERVVQEYFEEAALCLNGNFVKLCFASSDADLASLPNAYAALFLMAASCQGLLESKKIVFDYIMAVDTVSWYSALFSAGCISFPDGLYILQKCALLYEDFLKQNPMKSLCITGVMPARIAKLCTKASRRGERIALSSINIDSCTVTGHPEAVRRLREVLDKFEYEYKQSDMLGGVHTPLAEGFLETMRPYFDKIDFKKPQTALVSPLTGKLIKRADTVRLLSEQLLVQTLRLDLLQRRIDQVEELYIATPSYALCEEIKNHSSGTKIIVMDTLKDWESISTTYQTEQG